MGLYLDDMHRPLTPQKAKMLSQKEIEAHNLKCKEYWERVHAERKAARDKFWHDTMEVPVDDLVADILEVCEK